MRKLIHRYRRWQEWRKYTYMNKFEQILVLLKLKRCTWFESFVDWRKNNKKEKTK